MEKVATHTSLKLVSKDLTQLVFTFFGTTELIELRKVSQKFYNFIKKQRYLDYCVLDLLKTHQNSYGDLEFYKKEIIEKLDLSLYCMKNENDEFYIKNKFLCNFLKIPKCLFLQSRSNIFHFSCLYPFIKEKVKTLNMKIELHYLKTFLDSCGYEIFKEIQCLSIHYNESHNFKALNQCKQSESFRKQVNIGIGGPYPGNETLLINILSSNFKLEALRLFFVIMDSHEEEFINLLSLQENLRVLEIGKLFSGEDARKLIWNFLKLNKTIQCLKLYVNFSLHWKLFTEAIQNNKTLTNLSIWFIDSMDLKTEFFSFCNLLNKAENLIKIRINFPNDPNFGKLELEDILFLFKNLQNNKKLSELKFSYKLAEWKNIDFQVTFPKALKVLVLKNAQINEFGIQVICKLLQGVSLNVLNIRGNPIKNEGIIYLCENYIFSNPCLEELDLHNCEISEGICSIAKCFSNKNFILKRLNLSSNYLTFPGLKLLCENLKTNNYLKYLNLSYSHINFDLEIYKNLGKMICENKTLKELKIDGNNITQDSLITFITKLNHNKSLKHLSLNKLKYNFQKEGSLNGVFSFLIKGNNSIKNLSINENNLGMFDTFKTFLCSLDYNSTLQTLDLSTNNIRVFYPLEKNTTLKKIILTGNLISDISLKNVLHNLKNPPSYRLDFSGKMEVNYYRRIVIE
jgi:hypothetical protein